MHICCKVKPFTVFSPYGTVTYSYWQINRFLL